MSMSLEEAVSNAMFAYGYDLDPAKHIIETLVFDGMVVVLLESSAANHDDRKRGRNVFAFGTDGELVWRIQDSGFTTLNREGRTMPQGNTGIDNVGGELVAYQPIGGDCSIDLSTGEILSSEQSK